MTPRKMLAEVVKAQMILEVSNAKIAEIAGWSKKVFRSRWNNPDSITLGEWLAITSYLNLKTIIS